MADLAYVRHAELLRRVTSELCGDASVPLEHHCLTREVQPDVRRSRLQTDHLSSLDDFHFAISSSSSLGARGLKLKMQPWQCCFLVWMEIVKYQYQGWALSHSRRCGKGPVSPRRDPSPKMSS